MKKELDNKDKFTIIDQEESFLIEDDQVDEPDGQTEADKIIKTAQELKKKEKRRKIKKLFLTALVMTIISVVIFVLTMLFQWKLTLMAIGNAMTFTCALVFFAGWIMFVWNLNILSPFIHGIKTFGLMFVGKRPKLKYYDYLKKIEEEPIPKYYIRACLITALVLLIPSIVLTIITAKA